MRQRSKEGSKLTRLLAPRPLAAAADALVAVAGVWLALLLRFEGTIPNHLVGRLLWLSPAIAALMLLAGLASGLYRGVDEYVGIDELVRIAQIVLIVGVATLAFCRYALPSQHYLPLSVPVVGALILLFGLAGVRIYPRLTAYSRTGRVPADTAARVLIAGAGDAGEMITRDMLRHPTLGFLPVGLLDDDPAKVGRRIHGVPVIGGSADLVTAARKTGADHILIAMPSAPPETLKELAGRAVSIGLKPKIVPSLRELVGTPLGTAGIRDIDVADLIGRKPAKINYDEISECLTGKSVLVVGAAGSIGSELARRVLSFGPGKLWLLDVNESDLYCLAEELGSANPAGDQPEIIVASIRDELRMHQVFRAVRPQIVFHAAAYKHLPVMELHPAEAVLTNVGGTRLLAEASAAHGAERFVLISTDKAVDPTSVMGATKRLSELVVASLAGAGPTIFTSVRFGNVLGSRGSVVPIFARQIRAGGPITVTHPEATRYFMTIEEAAALIIQAAAFARGGEMFVLDMGDPVRILDLAERMRDLLSNGSKEKIEIAMTGFRPGEKLNEVLWGAGEDVAPTGRDRIYRVTSPLAPPPPDFEARLEALEALASAHGDQAAVRAALFGLTAGTSVGADIASPAVAAPVR